MMQQVMINTFEIFHTRLIGASQHVRRVQNPRKIGPENILKNILKTSENCPLNGTTNTIFHFVHRPKTQGSYDDMNFLFIVPSIHHSGESVMAR